MTSPFFKEMMLTDSTFPDSQSRLMSRAGDAMTQPGKRMRSQPCACPPHCRAALAPAAARLRAPAWITAWLPASVLQPGPRCGCPSPCPSLDHRVAALAVLAIRRSVRLRGAETPCVLSQGRETSAVPLQVQKAHGRLRRRLRWSSVEAQAVPRTSCSGAACGAS